MNAYAPTLEASKVLKHFREDKKDFLKAFGKYNEITEQFKMLWIMKWDKIDGLY